MEIEIRVEVKKGPYAADRRRKMCRREGDAAGRKEGCGSGRWQRGRRREDVGVGGEREVRVEDGRGLRAGAEREVSVKEGMDV